MYRFRLNQKKRISLKINGEEMAIKPAYMKNKRTLEEAMPRLSPRNVKKLKAYFSMMCFILMLYVLMQISVFFLGMFNCFFKKKT